MSAPVVARRPWDQRTVNTTDRIPGDGTAWPLASMPHKEILKWQRLIVNLRIYGHVQVTYDPFPDITFDFKLRDIASYIVPTELKHLTTPGLFATTGINLAGDPDDVSPAFDLAIGIGLSTEYPISGPVPVAVPVLYSSGSRYLPFYFLIDSVDGDTGAVDTLNDDVGDIASAISLTFNGEAVALFDNSVASGPTGDITIEIPTGVGDASFLTWGVRNADTGHFTTNSI